MGGNRRFGGLSLIEVIVALGLITASLMLVLGLIPVGIHAAEKARTLQYATFWSQRLLEECPAPESLPIPTHLARANFSQTDGPTAYQAVRTVQASGPFLYLITVETTWPGSTKPLHVELLRYNPDGPKP